MSIGPIRRKKGRKRRKAADRARFVINASGRPRLVFGAKPKTTHCKGAVWPIAFDRYRNLDSLLDVHPFLSNFEVMPHLLSRYDDFERWLQLNQRLGWAPTLVVRWCEERARHERKAKSSCKTTWTKGGELRCSLAFLGTSQRGNYAIRDRNGNWWFVFARKYIEGAVRREVLDLEFAPLAATP